MWVTILSRDVHVCQFNVSQKLLLYLLQPRAPDIFHGRSRPSALCHPQGTQIAVDVIRLIGVCQIFEQFALSFGDYKFKYSTPRSLHPCDLASSLKEEKSMEKI